MEASQSDRTLLLLIESDHSVSHREPPTDPDTLVASGTLFSPAEECICHAMGVSDVIWDVHGPSLRAFLPEQPGKMAPSVARSSPLGRRNLSDTWGVPTPAESWAPGDKG